MATVWLELLLDTFFPKFCCGCSKLDTYLCPQCFNTISLYSIPVTLAVAHPKITQIWAVAEYTGVIKQLIHTYKYECVQGIAGTLARFIHYTTFLPKTDLITSVPLHPVRFQERGFNQAALLGQHLAQLYKLEYQELLVRHSFSASQASLASHTQRQHNIASSFHLNPHCQPSLYRGKQILLVDDVCTTGATLNECAAVLLAAGAHSVSGLTVAHGS